MRSGNEEGPGLSGFLSDGVLPLLTLDPSGSVLSVNEPWVREMGHAREEVVGRPFDELVSPQDREPFREAVRCALTEGVFPETELTLVSASGDPVHAVFTGRVEFRSHGPRRIHCFFSNVTELREKEQEARENERKLNALVANLPGVVYRCRNLPGYPMELLMGQVEALTGYEAEEFLVRKGCRSWEDLILPDDREALWKEIQKKVSAGEPFEMEYRIQTQSHEVRWVWERGGAVAGESGEHTVLEGFITDITGRKSVELDLEERNVFIQTILDNLPIGLAVNFIDEGTAVYMNQEFSRIYGWPEEDLSDIGRFFELVYPDPEYGTQLKERVMADLASGDPDRMVWEGVEITRQDGEKRLATAKNIPLPEQNLMISTVWDVTDLARAREELERSVTALRSLADHIQTVREEEKTTIAREIHDVIGQALTAALMDAAFIKKGVQDRPELAERAEALIEVVREAVDESQRLSADLRPDLLEVLGLGAALKDFLDRTEERSGVGCRLIFEVEEETLGRNQGLQLYRLVQESITNVVRHAQASRVDVKVTAERDLVQVRVEDDGVGIDEEAVHDVRSWGLTGMRERLHSLGGTFQVRGHPGVGTVVDMSFPLTPP